MQAKSEVEGHSRLLQARFKEPQMPSLGCGQDIRLLGR